MGDKAADAPPRRPNDRDAGHDDLDPDDLGLPLGMGRVGGF